VRLLAGPGIDNLVGKYVSDKVGMQVTNTPFIGFAVYTQENVFVAGVVVSNFRKTDCEVSMAAETANWAKKGIMRLIFEYIFIQAGCIRCTCVVQNLPSTKRTRRFLEGIGFVLEGNLRLAYDGETDALVYGLLRRECRFLRENQGGIVGKEIRPVAAASA
jgi:RimJ/RimL family protein N-acetyltransferase